MTCGERFVPNPEAAAKSTNVMDNWIQAALQGLVQVRETRAYFVRKQEQKERMRALERW